MNIIQEYYNSERNAEIRWFWDEGFQIKFGDKIKGFEEPIYCYTWEEVEQIFRERLNAEKNIT